MAGKHDTHDDKNGDAYDGSTALPNEKYEKFARNIATEQFDAHSDAYMDVYPAAKKRTAASGANRLLKNENIQARIAFIITEATGQVIAALHADSYFKARSQVERLEQVILNAERDRNWTIAINARFKLLEMFGYGENPTMMHQHINKEMFNPGNGSTAPVDEETTPPSQNQGDGVVSMKSLFEKRQLASG